MSAIENYFNSYKGSPSLDLAVTQQHETLSLSSNR